MDHSQRPTKKRRKTGKRRHEIVEGDDITADGTISRTIIHQTENGPLEEVLTRRIWLQDELDPQNPEPGPGLDEQGENTDPFNDPFNDNSVDPDPDPNYSHRTQQDYLLEFVSRAHPMLKATLSREALQKEVSCPLCDAGRIARWRCKDCTLSPILCRGCMRDTHLHSPLHQIEVWTGQYFGAAALWQVGVHILVPHYDEEPLCATLKFHKTFLHQFQITHDMQEQDRLARGIFTNTRSVSETTPTPADNASPADYQYDRDRDAAFNNRLDEIYRHMHSGIQEPADRGNDLMEEDDPDTHDYPDLGIPQNYPATDCLQNPYIRVVHINGIHHISVVCCRCRGSEQAHADLMAQRLVPTSFIRYRTMFTHAVLDDFRLSNLECKTSAYHYFQKLRRQTAPMSPQSVPNLYHELRRMSRLWRWMKKLKWAGFAHDSELSPGQPPAGSLANFCPACPQPGINLPAGWHKDPQR